MNNKIIWHNDTVPALNAENLNSLTSDAFLALIQAEEALKRIRSMEGNFNSLFQYITYDSQHDQVVVNDKFNLFYLLKLIQNIGPEIEGNEDNRSLIFTLIQNLYYKSISPDNRLITQGDLNNAIDDLGNSFKRYSELTGSGDLLDADAKTDHSILHVEGFEDPISATNPYKLTITLDNNGSISTQELDINTLFDTTETCKFIDLDIMRISSVNGHYLIKAVIGEDMGYNSKCVTKFESWVGQITKISILTGESSCNTTGTWVQGGIPVSQLPLFRESAFVTNSNTEEVE